MNTKILSVGGSIIAPDKPDSGFLTSFIAMIKDWLNADPARRLILVAGGGAPARVYQNAYKEVAAELRENIEGDAADKIGIMATRLNAELVKALCGEICKNDVVYNPTENIEFSGRILVAAGWKPGFSTDNDAVLLAEKFSADTVLNLSNIEKVYTDDPKKKSFGKTD